jgi:hypothetical protein
MPCELLNQPKQRNFSGIRWKFVLKRVHTDFRSLPGFVSDVNLTRRIFTHEYYRKARHQPVLSFEFSH